MDSPAIQRLISLFAKLPGVGPKAATRFVFYLLRRPPLETQELINSLSQLQKTVKLCAFCLNPFEPKKDETLCRLCSDVRRDRQLLCLVEKETDLELLEKTHKYHGLYFVLGTLLTPLKKRETEKQIIASLLKRVKGGNFREVIIAISYTTEGEATSLYLERILKPFNLKITRLGRGLPIGAEIEYADEETLASALEGRTEV